MTTSALATQQRKVKIGIATGAAGYLAILAASYALRPLAEAPPLADRLGLAARCAVFPTLMLLAGIGVVANGRYGSDAIDPLLGREPPSMRVHVRYLQNTLEQLVLHLVALFAVAADGSALGMRLLPGLAACFVVGRGLFWIGYVRAPMKRAPGFAMTVQPTALALLFVAVRVALGALG